MLAAIVFITVVGRPPQADKAQIDAVCAQIAKATQALNWKKLKTLCTPDFKQTSPDGTTVDFKQLTDGFQGVFSTFKNLKVTYKLYSVKVSGKVAQAEAFWSVSGTGKDPQGKAHKVEFADNELDVFKKVKGHWLEDNVHVHNDIEKVDGKAVPTNEAGVSG